MPQPKNLVIVKRNNIYESEHRGWIAVCKPDGSIVTGTHKKFPDFFCRSSLKTVQALPLLLSGGMQKYQLELQELAVMLSSHSGEEVHVKTVRKILKTIGLSEKYLQCGTHLPYNPDVANKFICNKKEPTPLYCNCSGKHAGMLAACLINDWSVQDYLNYEHPLQAEIRKHLQILLKVKADTLPWGIDGCGVPTYTLPLNKLATLYACIANPDHNVPEIYHPVFRQISEAFLTYPQVIAGENRVDTNIMKAAPGQLISKIGGEAILGLGVPKLGLGLALKIADGANRPIIPAIVRSLKLLNFNFKRFSELEKLGITIVKNNAGLNIGTVEAVFDFF